MPCKYLFASTYEKRTGLSSREWKMLALSEASRRPRSKREDHSRRLLADANSERQRLDVWVLVRFAEAAIPAPHPPSQTVRTPPRPSRCPAQRHDVRITHHVFSRAVRDFNVAKVRLATSLRPPLEREPRAFFLQCAHGKCSTRARPRKRRRTTGECAYPRAIARQDSE